MGYGMKYKKGSFPFKSPLHENDDLKEGDYMTYETTMYDKEENKRTDITEEETSKLKKDKKGRLYATNLANPKDTIYAQKPIIHDIKK